MYTKSRCTPVPVIISTRQEEGTICTIRHAVYMHDMLCTYVTINNKHVVYLHDNDHTLT